MLSYEQWDAIADSYTPTLGVLSLGLVAIALFTGKWRVLGIRAIHLSVALIVAYGLMFIDNRLKIWESFGMDYSTHAAVCTGLVTFLCIHARKLAVLWLVSVFAYFALMLYQRYHSLADIVTTVAVVLTLLVGILLLLNKFRPIAVPLFQRPSTSGTPAS